MVALIDPPSPFASLAEWKAFRAEMRKLKAKEPAAGEYLAEAEAKIAELEGGK